MTVGSSALANAKVVYSCGCSAQAGETTTDGSGNYAISASATATPGSPNPTYTTVPGRNHLVVGAISATHQEAWTMLFMGNQPSHNLYLGSGGNATDTASTAAALYIVYESPGNTDTSFDDWNFNAISSWAGHLRSSPNAAEQKLMNDINSMDGSSPLWPISTAWDNDPGPVNTTIVNDIKAVKSSSDASIPTPCPLSGGSPACTGAPTP